MLAKKNEKSSAIKLRKRGFSYSEIMQQVPVAKSTLSLWLKNIGLAKTQKQRLTKKKLAASKKGGLFRKIQRINETSAIKSKSSRQIKEIANYELMLIGATLYWAEGAKQKEHNPSVGVLFSNSDLEMMKLFLKFLKKICNIEKNNVSFELFIHKTADSKRARQWWVSGLKIKPESLQKVYFKNTPTQKTKRKNISKEYHGQLRVVVKNSTNLNRQITGWIEGIIKNCDNIIK